MDPGLWELDNSELGFPTVHVHGSISRELEEGFKHTQKESNQRAELSPNLRHELFDKDRLKRVSSWVVRGDTSRSVQG